MEREINKSETNGEQGFYLFSSATPPTPLRSGSVFYRARSEQSATALCRLFQKEYSSVGIGPHFSAQSADEIEPDDQILLDETLDWLAVYDDPDPGIYDPPPTPEMMTLAQYAKRASTWESMLAARKGERKKSPTANNTEPASDGASSEERELTSPALPQMPEEDRLNSALNLLFLLAQAYYKILESAVGMATWCCALDLELNESYLWTTSNLQNLLKNHEGLRDFRGAFEPVFPDLYPSTIRDVEWADMVAPGAEQFLSSVQRYVREKGMSLPDEHSPAWTFVELFRPSIDLAIERALAYDKRMRAHARNAFGFGQNDRPQLQDDQFARMAVEEARKSRAEDGRPHPLVGCVVVKNGQVLATSHRGEIEGNHAEYIALETKLKDDSLAGCTVYTTLEPCTARNHPKIPCADRLVEHRVARVVVGMHDPNPDICGKGIRRLQAANIEVTLFPHALIQELEELNRHFTRSYAEARTTGSQPEKERKRLVAEKRKLYNLLRKINCIECNFCFPPGPQDACFNGSLISQINKDIECIRDNLVELLDLPEAKQLAELRIPAPPFSGATWPWLEETWREHFLPVQVLFRNLKAEVLRQ
jgi:pyrimidine deaminase RibD-like protein